MIKLAANLTMLYNEVDFLDRFDAAAKSGFTGVEYLFPYAYPKEQLAERLQRNRLVQVLHNLPAGDWAKGERGIACHPDRVGEFEDGVAKAIDYARTLGCAQVNCLFGLALNGGELTSSNSYDPARSTIASCSASSIRTPTTAGSAASTSRRRARSMACSGEGRTVFDQPKSRSLGSASGSAVNS